MPKTTTKLWDPAEQFATEADIAAYLEAALEEGDPALIAAALGDIARAVEQGRESPAPTLCGPLITSVRTPMSGA